jgi:hypothetical protein
MRTRWHTPMFLALIGLLASILACNAPAPTPQSPPPSITPDTVPPQETSLPSPTEVSPEPTPTTAPPTAATTESPLPTESPPTPSTGRPTPAPPVSTGPLDFPVPTLLDNWQPTADGGYEATIILRITGGAPPYVVHHDMDTFITEEISPAIVFEARGCSALVHTIIVESADGQSVEHDYWIPAPWCD